MVSKPVKEHATYADLCALPEHYIAEILGGNLYASPVWEWRQSLVTQALLSWLLGPFHVGENGPGGWWALRRPELHLGADVLVPDVGGWRRDRAPGLMDIEDFALVPDWVCEVLSSTTESLDRGKKLSIYAREGIRDVWLVNPMLQMLEVFRLDSSRWSLVAVHEGRAAVRAAPFDAVELRLGDLWPE